MPSKSLYRWSNLIKLYTNKFFTDNLRLYLRVGYGVDRERAFLAGSPLHEQGPLQRAEWSKCILISVRFDYRGSHYKRDPLEIKSISLADEVQSAARHPTSRAASTFATESSIRNMSSGVSPTRFSTL
jgi:hypothetical protein